MEGGRYAGVGEHRRPSIAAVGLGVVALLPVLADNAVADQLSPDARHALAAWTALA
jgi:hypothetical protein